MKYIKLFEQEDDWTKKGDLPIPYLNTLFYFIHDYPADRVRINPELFSSSDYGYMGRNGGQKFLAVRIECESNYFLFVKSEIESIKLALESDDIILTYNVYPSTGVLYSKEGVKLSYENRFDKDIVKRTEYKFDITIYKNI